MRRRGIADFPESGDDVVCSGTEKSPGETDETFAGINSFARAVASRDRDEKRVDRMLKDIARVEFEGIALRRKDDGRFERARTAGGAVRGEMQKRELIRIAREILGCLCV